jgi:hypothetical protein
LTTENCKGGEERVESVDDLRKEGGREEGRDGWRSEPGFAFSHRKWRRKRG